MDRLEVRAVMSWTGHCTWTVGITASRGSIRPGVGEFDSIVKKQALVWVVRRTDDAGSSRESVLRTTRESVLRTTRESVLRTTGNGLFLPAFC